MPETGPPEGGMPTPDMTRPPAQAERTLSPRERQKLEIFAQEHPDADTTSQTGQKGEDMPNRGMSE
jgi:hypothetical protein